MDFREDTLYIYCHGFFSPKELKFLGALTEITGGNTEYLHWGDMDLGGIRIFLYNQRKLFPGLKPYRMDASAYETAIAQGGGNSREKKKRRRKASKAGCRRSGRIEGVYFENRDGNRAGSFAAGRLKK